MENSQEKLRNLLHQKLDNIDVNVNSSSSFDTMQIKLSLQKFFYFHPRNFNIYYAAAILSSVLFNVVLGIQYFKNQNAVENKFMAMEEKISAQHIAYQQLTKNQIISSKPKIINEAEVLPKKMISSDMSRNIKGNSVVNEKIIIAKVSKAEVLATDSTRAKITISNEDKLIKASTKTLYIVKQDTIIQYDSIPLFPSKTKVRKK